MQGLGDLGFLKGCIWVVQVHIGFTGLGGFAS